MGDELRSQGRNEGSIDRNHIIRNNPLNITPMSDQSSVGITIVLTLGDEEVLNESTSSFEIAHQILGRQQKWLEIEQAKAENKAKQELEEKEE